MMISSCASTPSMSLSQALRKAVTKIKPTISLFLIIIVLAVKKNQKIISGPTRIKIRHKRHLLPIQILITVQLRKIMNRILLVIRLTGSICRKVNVQMSKM